MAKMDFDKILSATAAKLGFNSLREKQVETVTAFAQGNDVFVSLPTGSGPFFYRRVVWFTRLAIIGDKIFSHIQNRQFCSTVYVVSHACSFDHLSVNSGWSLSQQVCLCFVVVFLQSVHILV